MKTCIIVLLMLIISSGTVTASSASPTEVGADMVAIGGERIWKNMADDMMTFVCGDGNVSGGAWVEGGGDGHVQPVNANDSTTCHGDAYDGQSTFKNSVTKKIIGFASWQVKPFSYPTVQKLMGVCLAFAVGIMFSYLCLGGTNSMLAASSASRFATMKGVLGSGTSNNTLDNYGQNILTGSLAMIFSVSLIHITLLFSQATKLMMMESIADTITPSIESVTALYFFMAAMWVCVSLFFGASNLTIILTAGASFLIGALYTSDRTRHITEWCADYFFTMVMMQVFVIVITVVVVGTIADIKTGNYGMMMHPGVEGTLYFCLIGGLVYMCYRMCFGKTRLLSSGIKAVKLVI